MPAGSFSLVFDGDLSAEHSSQAFEFVKTDAAWQNAQAQWFIDHNLNPGPVAAIAGAFYMSAIFPQAINDIVEGTSFIRCNFPTGEMPNQERVLDKIRHISVYSPAEDGGHAGMPAHNVLRNSLKRHWYNTFKTSPPLPKSLYELWVEDVISDDLRHALITATSSDERRALFRDE